MRRQVMLLLCSALLTSSCSDKSGAASPQPVGQVTVASDVVVVPVDPLTEPGELAPGSIEAFGLMLPVGTTENFSSPTTRIYSVSSEMSRVMRYLKRRLATEGADGDVHPMAVMLKGVRVRNAEGKPTGDLLDLGVRDDGDRTMVTLWKRAVAPVSNTPIHTDESLRAAGFTPDGRPLPRNNY